MAPGSLEMIAAARPTAAVAMLMTFRTVLRVWIARFALFVDPWSFWKLVSVSSRTIPTALVIMSEDALSKDHSASSVVRRWAGESYFHFENRKLPNSTESSRNSRGG